MAIYGQELTFNAQAVGDGLVYVWRWWDGEVAVTAVPEVRKTANRHGSLAWSVTAVDRLGRRAVYASTVNVDRPPEILTAALDANYGRFPYVAQLGATVAGQHYPLSCRLQLKAGTADLLSAGTVPVASGTQQVQFNLRLRSPAVAELEVVDSLGVTARAPVFFYGAAAARPEATPPAAWPPVWQAGMKGTLTAAYDPENVAAASWKLPAAGGWQGALADWTGSGTLGDFGKWRRSSLEVDTAGQAAGFKRVEFSVVDTQGGTRTGQLELELRPAPGLQLLGMAAWPGAVVNLDGAPKAVVFSARAADPAGGPLAYTWRLSGTFNGTAGVVVRPAQTAVVLADRAGTLTSELEISGRHAGLVVAGPTVVVAGSAT